MTTMPDRYDRALRALFDRVAELEQQARDAAAKAQLAGPNTTDQTESRRLNFEARVTASAIKLLMDGDLAAKQSWMSPAKRRVQVDHQFAVHLFAARRRLSEIREKAASEPEKELADT